MKFTDSIGVEGTVVLANLTDQEINEVALMTAKAQVEKFDSTTKVTGDTVLATYLSAKCGVIQRKIEAKKELEKSANPFRDEYRTEMAEQDLSSKHIF